MVEKESYVGMSNENRKYFIKLQQSLALLEDILTYENVFVIEDLREIDGFNSKEAAEKFIALAFKNIEIAKDK